MKLSIRKKGKYPDKTSIFVIEDLETNKVVKQIPKPATLLEIIKKHEKEREK